MPEEVKDQVQDDKAVAIDPKEFEALKAQLAEKDSAVKYWYEKAASKAEPKAAKAEPEPQEDDDDVLSIITEKGSKGLAAYLAKRGFVTADEVERRVSEKATQLSREALLAQSYPELKDPKSEFFQDTAIEFGQLKKQGVSEALAMEMAAERVELRHMREGKIKTTAQRKEDAETERKTRAKAQQGERGGRPAQAEDGDDELTPEQKRICAAMGISEESYLKRAKAGVVTNRR